MKYKIIHIKAKNSIDGKDHYRVLKKVKPIAEFVTESWDSAIKESFPNYELAYAAMEELKRKKQ